MNKFNQNDLIKKKKRKQGKKTGTLLDLKGRKGKRHRKGGRRKERKHKHEIGTGNKEILAGTRE